MCTVGDETYLFTSGYVPWWVEYPGPTFQIGACGKPACVSAREILELTKMELVHAKG